MCPLHLLYYTISLYFASVFDKFVIFRLFDQFVLNYLKITNLSKTLAIQYQSAIIDLTKENNHLKGKVNKMTNEIKRLENEIKELEKVNFFNRDFEKIELLKKEIKELEDEIMKDLEW